MKCTEPYLQPYNLMLLKNGQHSIPNNDKHFEEILHVDTADKK
eukprot:UN01537